MSMPGLLIKCLIFVCRT